MLAWHQANILSLFKLLILLYFLLRGLGLATPRLLKLQAPNSAEDLGPDVKFEDLSFQTDQTYSFFIMNYLM